MAVIVPIRNKKNTTPYETFIENLLSLARKNVLESIGAKVMSKPSKFQSWDKF